jgi:hypothetical protein
MVYLSHKWKVVSSVLFFLLNFDETLQEKARLTPRQVFGGLTTIVLFGEKTDLDRGRFRR